MTRPTQIALSDESVTRDVCSFYEKAPIFVSLLF
jgi:hypothetical protein